MKGRIIISGTSSGAGKTTVTIALLKALKNRGEKLSCFKCGPDYIDPMFHREVLGVDSGNIDTFFYSEDLCKQLFCEHANDFSVIEGVMGYYDGGAGATANVAKVLDAKVILVVNGRGAFQSILATIHGFLTWKENNIAGVILNGTSENVFSQLKEEIEKMGVLALGYFPRLTEDLMLESRHLGLVTAGEISGLQEKIQKLAELAEECIDIDKLLKMGGSVQDLQFEKLEIKEQSNIKIAVSKDEAFCFCYRENISLLEKMGCEIEYFSPIHDKKLPDCDGLYLVGGYPELFSDKIQQNESMKQSVKLAIENGLPTIAECGGFMFLTTSVDGKKMCDVISGDCEKKTRLVRFGYVNMKCENEESFLQGEFKGHEFHYYDCTNNGEDILCERQNKIKYNAGHSSKLMYAGFPHLAFYSCVESVENFCCECARYKENR